MGNITQQDINFMNNISNIVNGNYDVSLSNNNQVRNNIRKDVNFTPDSSGMYMDDMKRYMRIVNESCESPDIGSGTNNSGSYDVIVEVDSSGSRVYKIKDSNRSVFRNKTFSVCESALAISKILNSHPTDFSEKYIESFINLDEEFSLYKGKALSEKDDYAKAKKLNEERAASIFESNFKNYHSKANDSFEQIKSLYNLVTK